MTRAAAQTWGGEMRAYAYVAGLALLMALLGVAFFAGLRWDAAQEARDAARAQERANDAVEDVDAGDSPSSAAQWLCERLGLGDCRVPGDLGQP